jgi:hypothetical protein
VIRGFALEKLRRGWHRSAAGASMSTTFRARSFASFYFEAILFIALVCVLLRGEPGVSTWAPLVLGAFALLGIPCIRAKVEVSDRGIIQTIARTRAVEWSEIISWERVGYPGSDGPETITIKTRSCSVKLNHNCVYGRRLDFVESELRRRIVPQAAGANSLPVRL